MEIADIYINSTRLVNAVSLTYVRYLHDAIDWTSRMICVKGARGVGKTTLMLQRIKQSFPGNEQAVYVSYVLIHNRLQRY